MFSAARLRGSSCRSPVLAGNISPFGAKPPRVYKLDIDHVR